MDAGLLRKLIKSYCSHEGKKVLFATKLSRTLTSLATDRVSSDKETRGRFHVGGEGVADTLPSSYVRNYQNRNPRSLELLGMAKKPRGYATRVWRVDYYHRLMLEFSNRHVSAYVNHNSGLKVVEASTKEFCISRHLYKRNDVAAAYNVGRVLAERCKDTGIYRIMWQHKKDRNSEKVKSFIKAFSEAGILLNEPKVRTVMPPPGRLASSFDIKRFHAK